MFFISVDSCSIVETLSTKSLLIVSTLFSNDLICSSFCAMMFSNHFCIESIFILISSNAFFEDTSNDFVSTTSLLLVSSTTSSSAGVSTAFSETSSFSVSSISEFSSAH
jgi:hypothetical protein